MTLRGVEENGKVSGVTLAGKCVSVKGKAAGEAGQTARCSSEGLSQGHLALPRMFQGRVRPRERAEARVRTLIHGVAFRNDFLKGGMERECSVLEHSLTGIDVHMYGCKRVGYRRFVGTRVYE